MFVYHFVDPELKVDLRFKKEGKVENGAVDFEIGDIGTSAHWHWRLKKISCEHVRFLLSFVHYWIFLIFLAAVQIWGKDKHINIKAVMLLIGLEVLEEGFFCFPGRDWEGVCRKLLSLGKLYQRF